MSTLERCVPQPSPEYPAVLNCHSLGRYTVLHPLPAAPSAAPAWPPSWFAGPSPFQTCSPSRRPCPSSKSDVPPTPTTVWYAAGISGVLPGRTCSFTASQSYQPPSPDDAVITMPGWSYAATTRALL